MLTRRCNTMASRREVIQACVGIYRRLGVAARCARAGDNAYTLGEREVTLNHSTSYD